MLSLPPLAFGTTWSHSSGRVFFPQYAHLRPSLCMSAARRWLRYRGALLVPGPFDLGVSQLVGVEDGGLDDGAYAPVEDADKPREPPEVGIDEVSQRRRQPAVGAGAVAEARLLRRHAARALVFGPARAPSLSVRRAPRHLHRDVFGAVLDLDGEDDVLADAYDEGGGLVAQVDADDGGLLSLEVALPRLHGMFADEPNHARRTRDHPRLAALEQSAGGARARRARALAPCRRRRRRMAGLCSSERLHGCPLAPQDRSRQAGRSARAGQVPP